MPSREQVAEVLLSVSWPDGGAEGLPTRRTASMLTDALMPLFDVARNEALEEAAAWADRHGWEVVHRATDLLGRGAESWDAAQIRALKSDEGGSSG